MIRKRDEQDPRMLSVYESIATAIYGHHSRQSFSEAQMVFLLSLLDGVYYQRLDEGFLEALRLSLETGLAEHKGEEWRELLTRTDLADENSVRAHCRTIRRWLEERAGCQEYEGSCDDE